MTFEPVSGTRGISLVRTFTPEEARDLVVRITASPNWQEAGINADRAVDLTVRDAAVLYEEDEPGLIALLRDRLFAATRSLVSILAPKTVLAELQVVRYRPGGNYVDHRDTPALGATPRALSLVCYLNDDFAGGATVFGDLDVAVAPDAGMTAIFSPVLMHRAEPVTEGIKYAVTAWYHTLPPTGD